MANMMKSHDVKMENFSKFYFTLQYTFYDSNHGNMIQTGTACKKIPCYIHVSACRRLIVENAKIFRSYVKYF